MSDDVEKVYYCPKCNKIAKDPIGGRFRIIQTDDWNFKVLENRATIERRQSKMDRLMQFAPLIGLGLVTILFIITAYFSYNYMKEIAGIACASAGKSIAEQQSVLPQKSPLDLLKVQ